MRLSLLLLCLALAGCDSASPRMAGGGEVRLTRDGRNYAVHVKGRAVEVIRFGWAPRAEQGVIRAQMVALIPEATGCLPWRGSVTGDSGVIRGRLRCPRGKIPVPPGLR
ncbi:hypothetical protein [Solirhodobacter olei]|uniref:hypothetical protein n=1 Tax=Solirhodobacter olei TaxID=2493082 RepID=UPI000FDBEE61|nr:hypothetical protein [Solirhodobacter olei]